MISRRNNILNSNNAYPGLKSNRKNNIASGSMDYCMKNINGISSLTDVTPISFKDNFYSGKFFPGIRVNGSRAFGEAPSQFDGGFNE